MSHPSPEPRGRAAATKEVALHAGVLAVLALLATPAAARAEAASRTLTLDECISIALTRNPDVINAQEEVAASVAAKRSIRGNLAPKLRFEGNVIRWSKPLPFDLGPLTDLMPLPAGTEIPPIREATTTTITLSLAQPLGSLWTIYEGYKVRDLGVDVAKVQREAKQRDTAYQTVEAFYRVLQAMRLADVAQLSVEQLETQVKRARSFYAHGLIAQNDLLRAELGLAAAHQQLIQARGNVTLAQAQLAFVLGLPTDLVITPAGGPEGTPPPTGISLTEAERRALTARVELREIEDRIQQARRGVNVAWSKMVPDLNGVASYQHNTGSSFQAKNEYFVGLFAAWNFWEWGATYYGISEAKARERQALTARNKVRDGIRLETRAAYVTLTTAYDALGVAEKAVVQAEENFRLVTKRYEAQAATSFDVVDAETQLTQARAQAETARYNYLIARSALARSMGEGPLALARPQLGNAAPPEGTHAVP